MEKNITSNTENHLILNYVVYLIYNIKFFKLKIS